MQNTSKGFKDRPEVGYSVVARIGPTGLEWSTSGDTPADAFPAAAEEETSAETEHALKDALHARRKAVALRAFQTEMRRRAGTMNEEDVLAEVARRRGVGSLHHDLGLG